jgi:PAS domain S-box-containing protein
LFDRALRELDQALEELRTLQEQVLEQLEQTDALRAELAKERDKYWRLFNSLPDACILTDADSAIVEANRGAAELFNISQRFLVGKVLSVFVSEDRGRFLLQVAQLAREGGSAEMTLRLRPRERAPVDVAAHLAIDGPGQIRWLIHPVAEGAQQEADTV